MCVQNFDDSRGPAIRITYRISLRSSSLWDPRHPLPKVVMDYTIRRTRKGSKESLVQFSFHLVMGRCLSKFQPWGQSPPWHLVLIYVKFGSKRAGSSKPVPPLSPPILGNVRFGWCDNDPSAGSPTETLLRLHLPLNDKVRTSSHSQAPMKEPNHNPESSPDHSIGRCDGRCVQRAGT